MVLDQSLSLLPPHPGPQLLPLLLYLGSLLLLLCLAAPQNRRKTTFTHLFTCFGFVYLFITPLICIIHFYHSVIISSLYSTLYLKKKNTYLLILLTEGERWTAECESAPCFTKSPKMSATSLSPVRFKMFSSNLTIKYQKIVRKNAAIQKTLFQG